MNEKLLLSIVIPAYNVEKYLERCLKSVIYQSCSDYEIIIVDDGSSDSTPDICIRYANKYNFIRMIHQFNSGAAVARNTGIKNANGKYIAFVDADDTIKKGSLQLLLDLIANIKQKADVISVSFTMLIENKPINYLLKGLQIDRVYKWDEYLAISMKKNSFRCEPWAYIYRRDFLNKNNLRFEEGLYHEDVEWTLHTIKCKPNYIAFSVPFYNYLIREGSITKSGKREKDIQDLQYIYKNWYCFANGINNHVLRQIVSAFVVKNYIYSQSMYKVSKNENEWNLSDSFILKNYQDRKELLKNIVFTLSRTTYYRLFERHYH